MGSDAPKLADFGLAKFLNDDLDYTRDGALLGTPAYMSPEQAEGGACSAGPATDIYGLGAVLYYCLTGRPPFSESRSTYRLLRSVIEDTPQPPNQLNNRVPDELSRICLRCLSKSPKQRYTTSLELAEELARWRAERPAGRRPYFGREWIGFAGILSIAILAVLAVCWLASPPDSAAQQPTEPRRARPLDGADKRASFNQRNPRRPRGEAPGLRRRRPAAEVDHAEHAGAGARP